MNRCSVFCSFLIAITINGSMFAQGQFFWSEKNIGEGVVVGDLDLFLNELEPSKEVFLYYNAQGQDIGTGVNLAFSFSELGVAKFTAAETFEFDVVVNGVPNAVRWGELSGPAFVSDNSVSTFTTLNIFLGEGLRAANTGAGNRFDTGYDEMSGTFQVGSITVESLQTGITELQIDKQLVVNDTIPIETIFMGLAINSIVECVDAAENDDWKDSVEISSNELPVTLLGVAHTNVDATTQDDEQQLDETGSTVWYNFVAAEDGVLNVNTHGSEFDTQLHIYTGSVSGFENLVPLIDSNDDKDLMTSSVSFAVESGQRYEIRVAGFREFGMPGSGEEGCIRLQVEFDSGVLLGDVNCDGVVNLLDVSPFVALVVSGEFDTKADIDQNGEVNLLDINPFVAILSGG